MNEKHANLFKKEKNAKLDYDNVSDIFSEGIFNMQSIIDKKELEMKRKRKEQNEADRKAMKEHVDRELNMANDLPKDEATEKLFANYRDEVNKIHALHRAAQEGMS